MNRKFNIHEWQNKQRLEEQNTTAGEFKVKIPVQTPRAGDGEYMDFYNKMEDFKAYLTFRCIGVMGKRATLNKPNLDHMCSDKFCLESWKVSNA